MIQVHDVYAIDGSLTEREELERLADTTVEYRRFDGDLALLEQRPATPQEVAAYEAWEHGQNYEELRRQGQKALDKNKAYAELDPPTAAQQTKQIEELTKQMNGLIRQVLGLFDDIEDAIL
jgi:Ni/Co efflux regulator RcnB